jgi:hypothetical protein
MYFMDDPLQDLKEDPPQDTDQDFDDIFLVVAYERDKLSMQFMISKEIADIELFLKLRKKSKIKTPGEPFEQSNTTE